MICAVFERLLNKFFSRDRGFRAKQEQPKVSYSQSGEDLIVSYVFQLRNIHKPSYIDIGAHDPYFLNNTAIFYLRGCRGINIDANPQLMNSFRKLRPKDVNLNIGIGKEETELNFYILSDRTLSTFNKQEAERIITLGKAKLVSVERMKLTPINSVLSRYNGGIFPDFLSIDVEGLDFDILKSIDYSKSLPKVICVEAAEYSPIGAGERRSEILNFLTSRGYFEYANTNLNAIMVLKDFWFI